jgi:hypothetical protein
MLEVDFLDFDKINFVLMFKNAPPLTESSEKFPEKKDVYPLHGKFLDKV